MTRTLCGNDEDPVWQWQGPCAVMTRTLRGNDEDPVWQWRGPCMTMTRTLCGNDEDPVWQWRGPCVAMMRTLCGNDEDPVWQWWGPCVAMTRTLCGNDEDPVWQWRGPCVNDEDPVWQYTAYLRVSPAPWSCWTNRRTAWDCVPSAHSQPPPAPFSLKADKRFWRNRNSKTNTIQCELKANQSDFLLSQYVRKLSFHSVLLFFSNEDDP